MEQLELWSAPAPVEGTRSTSARDEVAVLRAPLFMNARAERTRMGYETDWRLFERWCREQGECALPASFGTLARYMAYLAQNGRKASTIRRARVAIGMLHAQHGLPRPDRDDRIHELERRMGTEHRNREEGARPLLVPELERMMATLGCSARDDRDRALLLLGFAGAFRSSELVGLDLADIELRPDGLRVHVRRGTQDQRRGTDMDVPRAQSSALCAVGALECWLKRLDGPGPLFRLVYGARISQDRLSPRAVSRAVQRAAERAGLAQEYSSHSLRSGLATSAHAQGRSAREIQAHGRWRDLRSIDRYTAGAHAVVVSPF